MKILQVHNYYRFFGGECSVVDSERRLLQSHGHEVVPYTVQSRGSLLRTGLGLAQLPYNTQEARRLRRFVERHRPDVAHVHNVFPLLSPSVYVVLKRSGVPVVQTIHNYRFLCPNGLLFTHGRVCNECVTRGYFSAVRNRCIHDNLAASALYASAVALAWRSGNLPGNIDCYIAHGRFVADMLIVGGVPTSRIRMCGNFVESPVAGPARRGTFFLYLGRLSAEKGVRTLLDAVQNTPGVTLKVAGRGPLEDELKRHAAGRAVEFLGFVSGPEKELLIRKARGMIVPSECYEDFPLSVAESLSLGTPVIASRIGGLPEMVDHGKTGLLFSPGNARELSACITELARMETPALDAMAAEAMDRARVRFSPRAHYDRLMEIYGEIVPTAHGTRGLSS